MRILICRHAERNSTDQSAGTQGPGLSRKGFLQAENLAEQILAGRLPRPTLLLASPKLRSQQSLQKVADVLGLKLDIRAELDERQSEETAIDFRKRISLFLERCEVLDGTIYACSHLDWIEEALVKIPADSDLLESRFQTWKPGQYMLFQVDNGLWHLEEFGGIQC